jgi:hypothetical protein
MRIPHSVLDALRRDKATDQWDPVLDPIVGYGNAGAESSTPSDFRNRTERAVEDLLAPEQAVAPGNGGAESRIVCVAATELAVRRSQQECPDPLLCNMLGSAALLAPRAMPAWTKTADGAAYVPKAWNGKMRGW